MKEKYLTPEMDIELLYGEMIIATSGEEEPSSDEFIEDGDED